MSEQEEKEYADLQAEYTSLMEKHLEAHELGQEELAEELIKKANAIRELIFSKNPKKGEVISEKKPQEDKDIEELNRNHINKNKIN
jgi:ribosome-binding protein aMBF1 (putative translation factor)